MKYKTNLDSHVFPANDTNRVYWQVTFTWPHFSDPGFQVHWSAIGTKQNKTCTKALSSSAVLWSIVVQIKYILPKNEFYPAFWKYRKISKTRDT